MEQNVEIKFKRLRKKLNHIPLPSYATKGSAGLDIFAAIEKPITLLHGAIEMVPTNISVEIPDGYEIG
jgi:dUTP pyrophosphatase